MSLDKWQQSPINLDKIDVNHSLTREEVLEVLKLTQKNDWNNLNAQINSNQKIKKLISKDYSQINNARLSTYSKYWVNMLTFQEKLVKLWFDLWGSWKNENWIDWFFWKITFLAIVKIQKIIWIEPNWIINIDLLWYLYPDTFRTRNKDKKIWRNADEVNALLQEKIEKYEDLLKKKQWVLNITKENKLKIIEDFAWDFEEDLKPIQVKKNSEIVMNEDLVRYIELYQNRKDDLSSRIWLLNFLNVNRSLSQKWQIELSILKTISENNLLNHNQVTRQLIADNWVELPVAQKIKSEIITDKDEKPENKDKKKKVTEWENTRPQKKKKRKTHTWKEIYADNWEIKFYWIWKVRKNPWDKVTNCAWINRQTLLANWIKWFHYTAKWKTYSYLQHMLNPKTRDTSLFRRPGHENVTEPSHLYLSQDFSPTENRRFLKTREGNFIRETKMSDFTSIDSSINDWEIISIVMDSRTSDWKKYWHMATWMKIVWELFIVDPVLLKHNKPVSYQEYIAKLNTKKTWWKQTYTIKWIISYDQSHNTNETYLASISQKDIKIASNNKSWENNKFN